MIITGIIICAVALILALLNMGFLFKGVTTDKFNEGRIGTQMVLHVICGIGWVVGLAVIAIGVVQALTN